MKLTEKALGILLMLIMAAIMPACSIPFLVSSQPEASPTPLGDTLSLTEPAYSVSLEPGDTIPGTRLQYLGRVGDAYEVSIDGLKANKRSGDSFIWNGVLAPGVHASYNLRLVMAILGPLRIAGPVTITVFNPSPVKQPIPDDQGASYTFSNIVASYVVPVGRQIPGTTLYYEGMVTQGEGDAASQLAQLSGLEGYPYLAIGDSLIWSGRLVDQVLIRYSLRVVAMNEENLRVAGTAQMWISPSN